jgi:uncharacterized membrane protein
VLVGPRRGALDGLHPRADGDSLTHTENAWGPGSGGHYDFRKAADASAAVATPIGGSHAMSTVVIIVIVAVVVVLVVALLAVLPALRRRRRERELERARTEQAQLHRDEARDRAARADLAEQEAAKARAEAEIHEKRAELHERGLADDELERGAEPRGGRFRRDDADEARDRDVAASERRTP